MKRRPPAALKLAIGRAIRARRLAMGVSQAEIAARCRAVKGTVAHIEVGIRVPSLAMLNDLGWALNCEPWQLLKEASEMKDAST